MQGTTSLGHSTHKIEGATATSVESVGVKSSGAADLGKIGHAQGSSSSAKFASTIDMRAPGSSNRLSSALGDEPSILMHNGRLVELHMQIKNSPKNALAKSFDGNGLMIGHTTLRGYFRGVQAQQIIRAANAPNTPAPALEKQPTSTTPAPARNRLPWLAALEAHKPAAATTGIEDKVLGASIGQFFTSAIIVDATTGAFQGAVFAPSESLRAQVVG